MKKLKFANDLAPLILNGSKTATWRLFDDKDLQVSDKLEFLNSDTGEKFAVAEVTSVKEKPLGEITEEDFNGHETFSSKEEMLSTYRGYYGEEVNWDTRVKIVSFELKHSDYK